MSKLLKQCAIFVSIIISFNAFCLKYDLDSHPKSKRIVGEVVLHTVSYDQSFYDIADLYNVGVLALVEANQGIDPLLPDPGSQVVIPLEIILPKVDRVGVVINLPELRLFFFPKDEPVVYVFPIGIGRHSLATPNMESFISEKRRDPQWYPPKSLRARYLEEQGIDLPPVVKAGPDNPLGKFALRLGQTEYLIHGTNLEVGIGLRVSSGCVRMFPDAIEWLYEKIRLGTPVKIVNQPIKMAYGKNSGEKFIQIHKPLSELPGVDKSLFPLPDNVHRFIGGELADFKHVFNQLKRPSGLVIALEKDSQAKAKPKTYKMPF